MRKRKTLIILAIVALLVALTIGLLAPRRASATLLRTIVLGDRFPTFPMPGMICADTEFYLPPNCSLAVPKFELVMRTTAGWQRQDAVQIGPITPWNPRPGATNRACFVLPNDALRWHLILTGREMSFRSRFFDWLNASTAAWARDRNFNLRPIWVWVGRRVPNSPGRRLQLESDLLKVYPKHLRLRPQYFDSPRLRQDPFPREKQPPSGRPV